MNATKILIIPLSRSLSIHVKKAHVFYGLHRASLISLVQLCDNDCISILDKNDINILKNNTLVLKGHRNNIDGLWDIPISRPLRYCTHAIITGYTKKQNWLDIFMDAASAPPPRTYLKAVENLNFLTRIGLNNQHFLKHITRLQAHQDLTGNPPRFSVNRFNGVH